MARLSGRNESKSVLLLLILVTFIGLAGFVVGIALTLLTVQALINVGIPLQDRPALLIVVSVLMLQGVGFGSVGLGYLYLSGRGIQLLNIQWPGIRDIVWFIGGLLGLFALLITVNLTLLRLGIETAQHELVEIGLQNPEILLVLIPLSILLVGPGEELLFRGIIQQLLRQRFGPFMAISLASVLFAIAHVGALTGDGLLPTIIVYLLLSLVLGGVYEYSGNLVVPALIHGSFNAIQFFLLYLVATFEMVQWITV